MQVEPTLFLGWLGWLWTNTNTNRQPLNNCISDSSLEASSLVMENHVQQGVADCNPGLASSQFRREVGSFLFARPDCMWY